MCEGDDLQVIGPLTVDNKKREVLQREPTHTAARAPNELADRRVFGDQMSHGFYVVPQPVP